MNQQSQEIQVKVSAAFACFTCPDFGAERVSYPVMTPSAARGVLESIFWKPEIRFVIERIQVLRDIRYQSFKRNEVANKLELYPSKVKFHKQRINLASKKNGKPSDSRIQINTVALRDVEYIIVCRIELVNPQENLSKYYETFMRRLRKGQCFQRPFLGMKEFIADFSEATGEEVAISHTQHLGKILMGWQTIGEKRIPRFFDATLHHGVLDIPNAARYMT